MAGHVPDLLALQAHPCTGGTTLEKRRPPLISGSPGHLSPGSRPPGAPWWPLVAHSIREGSLGALGPGLLSAQVSLPSAGGRPRRNATTVGQELLTGRAPRASRERTQPPVGQSAGARRCDLQYRRHGSPAAQTYLQVRHEATEIPEAKCN